MDATVLAGLNLGFAEIPWGIVAAAVILVVGIFVIRAAISLVKVALVVAICIGAWLLFEFALKQFTG